MTDAINAESAILSERELDCVNGGIKCALEGVCRRDKVTPYQSDAAIMFQRILQQMAGQ